MGSNCSKAGDDITESNFSEDMSVLTRLQYQLEKEIADTEQFKEQNDKVMGERVRELLDSIDKITSTEERGVVMRQIDHDIDSLPRVPSPFVARQRQPQFQVQELQRGLHTTEKRFQTSKERLSMKLTALNTILSSHDDQSLSAIVMMQAVARGMKARLLLRRKVRMQSAIAAAAFVGSMAAHDATVASTTADREGHTCFANLAEANIVAIAIAAAASDAATSAAIRALTTSRTLKKAKKAPATTTTVQCKATTGAFNIYNDTNKAAAMKEIEEIEKRARDRLAEKKAQKLLRKQQKAAKGINSNALPENKENAGNVASGDLLNISNGQQLAEFLSHQSTRPPVVPRSRSNKLETASVQSSGTSVSSVTGSAVSSVSGVSAISAGSSLSRTSSVNSLRSSKLGGLLLHSQKVCTEKKKMHEMKQRLKKSRSSLGKEMTTEERAKRRAAKAKLAEYQAKLAGNTRTAPHMQSV